jgi:nitroreductase
MDVCMDNFIAPHQLVSNLQWRYATKKFDPTRKIPDPIWSALEDSLVLAPSSFGLQPWKFFVIQDQNLRQQLLPHSYNQTQVVEASHLVVFAIKTQLDVAYADRYLERMAEVQGVPIDTLAGFGNMLKGFLEKPPLSLDEWAVRQVYIALGQFMASAAMVGVDTCPMEGFIPAKYDEILGLPQQGYRSVVLCPAGYRDPTDKHASRPKVRFPKSMMVGYLP